MSAATPAAPLVEMESISKDFAGVRALDGVSLSVRPGEVHGLIGENGAGKSTLMRILDGVIRPSAGRLRWRGAAVSWRSPAEAQRHGIAMIHQELHGVGELSVAENILLGREPGRGGFLRRDAMAAMARECLAGIGCDLDPWRPFRSLSLAEQQMVEIAKALSQQAEVLIMDEPTAVLTPREVGPRGHRLRFRRSPWHRPGHGHGHSREPHPGRAAAVRPGRNHRCNRDAGAVQVGPRRRPWTSRVPTAPGKRLAWRAGVEPDETSLATPPGGVRIPLIGSPATDRSRPVPDDP